MMFHSYGILTYSDRIADKPIKPGWLIVETDPELARYLGRNLQRFLGSNYKAPMRGPHITVTAGEKEEKSFNFQKLNQYHGVFVDFEWNWPVYTNGRAYWLNIKSDALAKIRNDLGLLPRVLHMTIGNIK